MRPIKKLLGPQTTRDYGVQDPEQKNLVLFLDSIYLFDLGECIIMILVIQ